jgi:uncharacterized protein (TIGR03067 family)
MKYFLALITVCLLAPASRYQGALAHRDDRIPWPSKWISVPPEGKEWKYEVDLFFLSENRVDVRLGDRIVNAWYAVDVTKNPSTIDWQEIAGKSRCCGIFCREGYCLKLCWAWRGYPRPTEFKESNGRVLPFQLERR